MVQKKAADARVHIRAELAGAVKHALHVEADAEIALFGRVGRPLVRLRVHEQAFDVPTLVQHASNAGLYADELVFDVAVVTVVVRAVAAHDGEVVLSGFRLGRGGFG